MIGDEMQGKLCKNRPVPFEYPLRPKLEVRHPEYSPRPEGPSEPYEIRINYESMISAEKEIRELSQEIYEEARRIGQLSDNLGMAWKGVSGEYVHKKCDELGAVQKVIGDSIDQIAGKIRTAANAIKDADEQAASNMD